MTSAPLSRAFVADIEIRAGDAGDGRTVGGIVVPFGQIARVSDGGKPYREAFQKGSFQQAINNMAGNFARVKFLAQHEARRNPLGRATMLRDDTAGLYGEFRVAKTTAGDEALELIREGALDSFSVGFTPIKHSDRDGVTWRTVVGLREASLVTFPAYDGALVQSVRDEWDGLSDELREEALAWLAQAHDLRSEDPDGEPTTEGTPDGGAPSDEAASQPLRSVTQDAIRHLRARAREAGVI